MELSGGSYPISIGGRWRFEDLTTFTSEYEKLYGFYYYVLSDRESSREELNETAAYPWRGGFSTVNFFRRLYHSVPKKHKPRIVRIEYASPGVIELQVAVEVAAQITLLVGMITANIYGVFGVYRKIHRDLSALKLTSLSAKEKELEIAERYSDFISDSLEEMGDIVGHEYKEKILEMAPNKLAALKLQMSVFRRLKPLSELAERGLLITNGDQSDDD